MRKCTLLMLSVVAFFMVSCSSEMEEMQTTPNATTRSVEPRFVSENITTAQAQSLATKFLNKTSFFYFDEVLGWDPSTYVYHGAFSVKYGNQTLYFRAIDCGITGKNGRYGVYASSPVTSVQFYNVENSEYPDIHGEILYEDKGVGRAPVGVRYYYSTNCSDGNNNCWVVLEWASASAFESIIGY